MQPGGILKPFDITENISTSLGTGFVIMVMNPFIFQRTTKTFHDRIVITISFSTHANLNLVGDLNIADGVAGLLAASI
jgi:hypothetical protein